MPRRAGGEPTSGQSYSPNHACWSPSTSMARPKSASLTAAPFSLDANSRFSGCRRRCENTGLERSENLSGALLVAGGASQHSTEKALGVLPDCFVLLFCPWNRRGSQTAKISLPHLPCVISLRSWFLFCGFPAALHVFLPAVSAALRDSGLCSTVFCITDGVPCPPTGTLPAAPTFRSR